MGVLGTKHPGRDKDYAFMDWSGGLNAHTASECSPNEFSALCNFKPRRKGGWETRQGLDRVTNTPAPGRSEALRGLMVRFAVAPSMVQPGSSIGWMRATTRP